MTSKSENCDSRVTSNKSDSLRAPDGGFGWLIVLAYGTANVSALLLRWKVTAIDPRHLIQTDKNSRGSHYPIDLSLWQHDARNQNANSLFDVPARCLSSRC